MSDWDIKISSHKGGFNLNLREVAKYKDLLFLLVKRDFISIYKQTILGPLWFFIQPIFQTVIFGIIFGQLAKLAPSDVPQPVFFMSGIVLWQYFSDCLFKTSETFITNQHVFGKVYFPRLITPLSIIVSALLKLGVQLMLFLVVFLVYFLFADSHGLEPNWTIILVPFYILMAAGISMGLGLIVTSYTTKYRDLKFLIQFGIQLLMYYSTVIMSVKLVEQKPAFGGYMDYVMFNPMSPIIEAMRHAFIGEKGGVFEPLFLLYSLGFMLVVLLIGIAVFNKTEKDFVDTV